MAEFEDTSLALGRLEAALNRIAAQVGKPRPALAFDPSETDGTLPAQPAVAAAPAPAADETPRQEIVAKLDDLIGGLRNALGIERQS
ncbi:hypothetical protein ACELLULO517_19635 [Acidisoma cellulosilytica]|uniref:Uncharacterized protein n=1 Tax=Acidisoma cellulosilyticum TaxID=2802395 RepID=A0A963Z452_9PROT|nr:hypothetical protein [Acidisoma cellulosilyticum]MCB8882469.1 hypothetical protein [Acidisoma cellulosilyticum]